jgi:hypothetical protein
LSHGEKEEKENERKRNEALFLLTCEIAIISLLRRVAAIAGVHCDKSLDMMRGAASRQKTEYSERYSSSVISGLPPDVSSLSALYPICNRAKRTGR